MKPKTVSFYVRCIDKATMALDRNSVPIPLGLQPEVGKEYHVTRTVKALGRLGYFLEGFPPGEYFCSKLFEKTNPYSNSISLELAKEAVKERVETDFPVKEIVNN